MNVPEGHARAVAGRVAGELATAGARAVALVGSHARGEAMEASDVDLVAVGEGVAHRLERVDELLVSVSWAPEDEQRRRFDDPAWLATHVPGWREAVPLHDLDGIAAALKREAAAWSWERVEEDCDRWVAEGVTGFAEEAVKLRSALERREDTLAASQRSLLAVRLAPFLAVHRRLLYGTENRLWDLLAEELGPAWRAAQRAALGLGGETLEASSRAALCLYALAVREVRPLLDERQAAVVDAALAHPPPRAEAAADRGFVDGLAPALARHASILRRLLEALERDARFRALELQCSVARGAGDELSDLDLGIWVADDALDGALADLPGLLRGVDETVDLLDQEWDGAARRFFVQYASGVQVDAVALPARRAQGRVPEAVVLLDRDGLLAEPYEPPSRATRPGDRREWAFLAWIALADLDKYLRRSSLWEARERLEEARRQLLRLHAAAAGAAYPSFGLTALLDEDVALPAAVEGTVAGLDAEDLREAARACAGLLVDVGGAALPIAAWVQARLA